MPIWIRIAPKSAAAAGAGANSPSWTATPTPTSTGEIAAGIVWGRAAITHAFARVGSAFELIAGGSGGRPKATAVAGSRNCFRCGAEARTVDRTDPRATYDDPSEAERVTEVESEQFEVERVERRQELLEAPGYRRRPRRWIPDAGDSGREEIMVLAGDDSHALIAARRAAELASAADDASLTLFDVQPPAADTEADRSH
ncbi:hypothetical protein JCM18549_11120 [Halolamina salina]